MPCSHCLIHRMLEVGDNAPAHSLPHRRDAICREVGRRALLSGHRARAHWSSRISRQSMERGPSGAQGPPVACGAGKRGSQLQRWTQPPCPMTSPSSPATWRKKEAARMAWPGGLLWSLLPGSSAGIFPVQTSRMDEETGGNAHQSPGSIQQSAARPRSPTATQTRTRAGGQAALERGQPSNR